MSTPDLNIAITGTVSEERSAAVAAIAALLMKHGIKVDLSDDVGSEPVLLSDKKIDSGLEALASSGKAVKIKVSTLPRPGIASSTISHYPGPGQ